MDNFCDRAPGVPHVLRDVPLPPGRCDVEEVVSHTPHFAPGNFSRADVEPAVYLSRVCGDYLAVETMCKFDRERGFTNRRRPDDNYDFLLLLCNHEWGIVGFMQLNKILRFVALAGVFLLPFIPIYVARNMFFPFITGKNFAFRIIVEIVFAAWLLLAIRDKTYGPRRSTIMYVLAALLGVVVITDFTGVHPFQSLWSNFERMEGLLTLLHLGAYFLAAGSLLMREKLWKGFWHTSLVVSAYLGFYGVLQLSGVKEINQGGVRLDATLGNATYFAIYMVFHAFIAAFYLLRHNRGKVVRALYVLLLALQLYTLYHTATRGALLGFLGGAFLTTILIAIFGKEHRALRRASLGALAGLLILVGAFFALRNTDLVRKSEVLGRFATLSFSEGQVRFYVWKMGLQGFKERPILGWGQGNFDVVFNKYYDPRMYTQEPWFDRAHDIVFDWLVTAGVFGLLGYLALFGVTVALLWRDRAEVFSIVDKSLLTGLLAAYLFHNIFVFDNITSYILFFSVLAFIHSRESTHALPIFAQRNRERVVARTEGAFELDRVAIPIVLIALVVTLYALNIKGINASRLLIQAISPQEKGVSENLALFRRAIAASPVGRIEAREQLVQFALEAAAAPAEKVPTELKEEIARSAEKEMLAMLETMPHSARHLFFLGAFYRRVGRHEDAVKTLEKALELSPHKQQLRFELGLTHLDRGESEKALAVLKTAHEDAPEYAEARMLYALTAVYSGELNLTDRLLTEQFGSPIVDDNRVLKAYFDTGHHDRVVSIWQKRVEKDPTNAQTHLSLAASFAQVGNRAQAIAEVERAIELRPDFKDKGVELIRQIRSGTL